MQRTRQLDAAQGPFGPKSRADAVLVVWVPWMGGTIRPAGRRPSTSRPGTIPATKVPRLARRSSSCAPPESRDRVQCQAEHSRRSMNRECRGRGSNSCEIRRIHGEKFAPGISRMIAVGVFDRPIWVLLAARAPRRDVGLCRPFVVSEEFSRWLGSPQPPTIGIRRTRRPWPAHGGFTRSPPLNTETT